MLVMIPRILSSFLRLVISLGLKAWRLIRLPCTGLVSGSDFRGYAEIFLTLSRHNVDPSRHYINRKQWSKAKVFLARSRSCQV